ncbi:hypothetical protein M409DRAFT_64212 [Zasmidium cellare ATCC 36951]|uniref:Carrier domain-containing protein n=1 Tax=Zasmidium cellare ATCC 36951 TaxID=1080233 RepID=A0A6A6CUU6_ZASCE|nr:uncharacterized protein M409DRAFT_64212 [Zasmidium cellare ATCC 36951]KAF2170493.1 hypothetical protein M409DRAFT_64212 [Zasmidium cellare ATCC 36951]
MATSPLSIQPTLFPRLDTLAATISQDRSRPEAQQRYRRRQFSYASNPAAQPKGKAALLRDYSCFIASFTGDAEVCFQFALRNDLQAVAKPEIVHASVVDPQTAAGNESSNGDGCIVETSPQRNVDVGFDFGLELFADPDNFECVLFSPNLDCPFVVQYHATELTLVLLYDSAHLDDTFAEIAWDVLVQRLSRKLVSGTNAETKLSVLNHPPLLHPPPLSQLGKSTLPDGLLHAGFQRSAARWPNRAALHFHTESVDEVFTYAELDDLTTSFAHRLREYIPTRPDQPGRSAVVPAYMSNSTAFYVCWLAVLKAGFAFCPLPVDAPPEQLRGIVEEVGASLVLTNGPQVGGRPWDAWYCDDDELATCLDSLPEIRETDLAYIMYTSGSTGKPKGVKIHHHAAACSIASHSRFIPSSFFKDGFRWFQFAAPTFDPSIMEIFTTWWTGGTLCGAPRDMLLTDPEHAINQLSANIMMATPSMASVLRPEKVPTLRSLWTMGEKLTPTVIQKFSSDSPSNSPSSSHTPSLQRSRKLLNAYGPTEASINCNIVPDFSSDERGSIIGQPIDACSILVIDPSSRSPTPVPIGFSGELAIGGPQVSQGYLNRPEQTAAAFVSSSEYGRLYRTGDRARVVKTKSGELTVEFLGRLTSDQVKLSGRRVELGQIESAIATTSGVIDTVAVVHQHGPVGQGSEQVVACIVSDGRKPDEDLISDCRKSAETILARFMQPSRYFVLESMPRSRSGKTDRKSLGAIIEEQWDTVDVSAASSDSGYDSALARSMVDAATMSTVVESIAAISDIEPDAIRPSTELLSLGLDSLRAVRLLQQLREKGISHLTVAGVLSSRTVEGLAQACSQGEMRSSRLPQADWDGKLSQFSSRHLQPSAKSLGIAATDIEKVLPTTATQSGMIASFLRSVSRQTTTSIRKKYINHSVYYQSKRVDTAKLEQAWRTALARPEILRTVFVPVDDELAPFGQCILAPKAAATSFEVQHFESSSADEWDETLKQAEAASESSITLDKPPFRLSVIRSPTQTAYLLSLFHAVFDGGSLELLLQAVENAYLGNPLVTRTDISHAVRKHFSEANDETVKYWKAEFQDFEPIPFPCVSASKPETQTPDALVEEVIGRITLEKLSEASKKASVSPLSILQAAWATVLFAYTGSTADVSFGSVVSDRLEEDLSSCIAPTFVVSPSRISASTASAREIMSQLTRKNAEGLPYHHIPLSSLTTAEGTLPYDTLLAFQAFDKSVGSSKLWNNIEYPPMGHDFAIMIEVWPTETGPLRLRGTYTYEHLDPAAAKAMLKQLDNVVSFLCENPEASFIDARFAVDNEVLSQIPVVSENPSGLPESDLLLHAAFEKHALQNSDKSALTFRQAMDGSLPDIEWTYGKLYSLAKTFASTIINDYESVTNEPVMICMEKCAELYVAILGVLLAGAGWCPIDPYSPPARQHAIMERTGSRLLLLSPTASDVSKEAIPAGVSTLNVDLPDIETQATQAEAPNLDVHRDPSHLAYLIFTSGTTGLPKGVPITHKAGATAMHALAESIPSDVSGGVVRCMQFSQYTFDVFVQDLFYTWTLGGTVISSTRQIMIQNFAELANGTKATHAHLTPAFSATVARSNIKTLEVVTMIGEKLTEAVAADWGTDMRSYNTYGPAETTVVSTLRQFTGKSDTYHSSNVGVPLQSVGTYVVQDGNVVIRGGIGELALSGPQLSPGYWRLPEVNAKKFIWNEKLQQRLYLTGDLVRHLADGTLNFVGRNDDLVKLGGIRVELGEIAFALREADARIEKFEVLHCKRKDAEEKLVVAFMACPSVAASGEEVKALTTPAAKELAGVAREYGRKVLPPYMLPTTFIVLPRIPRTASAKVDRAAMTTIYHGPDLAAWEGGDDVSGGSFKDQNFSWRAENRDLLQIIADSLRVSTDSLHPASSLPAIGIDSIGAIRLIPKINAAGYNLAVVDAFKCRTLSDLCELAQSTIEATKRDSDQPLEKILERFDSHYYSAVSNYLDQDELSVIPTTILQESLLSESFKDAQAYWSSHLFQLEADVDLNKLKRAWTKVARNTEALRVGFVAKAMLKLPDDSSAQDRLSYLQVVYDEPQVYWEEHTISDSVDEAARERVQEIANYHHLQLFKLPLWAVDVFHRKDGTSVMMITIHHSIYDGPSLTFLEDDVKLAYSRASKTPQRLPLRDAVTTRSAIDADNEETKSFWKVALEDFEAESGEQDMADQADSKLQHRILYHRSTTPFSKLRSLAQELDLASVVTILRTAWALVLTDLLESPHVLFAEILSDRIMDNKLENVIGPLMSTVPSLFKRKATAAETLIEQDKFSKAAFSHRNIRPGTIKTLLSRGSSSHVYPAMFAFHPAGGEDSNGSKQLWKRLDDATYLQVEHPLAFNVWQDHEPCPCFEMAVASHLMTDDEQKLLLRQLDALVAAMVQDHTSTLSALTDGLPTELLSRTTPRKDTKCPSSLSPTHYVEHWAETHPEWIGAEVALSIEPDGVEVESWTYAQFNAEANRVAHWILERGISKRMIGMCLGRTLISFAVLIGIMKSGNCYLPIDESLPAERKSFLLEDSQSAFVFTDGERFADVDVPEHYQLVNVEAEDFQQAMAAKDASNPVIEADGRDNCYLLYTSGSTGKPKGVLVNRLNVASFSEAQSEFICDYSTTADTAGRGRWLCLASRAFDVHLGETFLAWRHGISAITAPRSMLLDDLALALSSLHITHCAFVPSLLDQTGLTPDDAPDLVYLGVGGEKMSPKTKKLWGGTERVGLINAYGPTEATIGCCSARLYPGSDMRDIGSPLGDSQAHILIPCTDNYALRNMPGELCFTGSLIANGYLNRPDAKGFVENFHGKRMYRTGDIVKLGLDDHVYFMGRKDDQVKIRGQRVELGEVAEGVRTASPVDINVAALVVKHPELSRVQLVAFIAANSSKNKSGSPPEITRSELQEANTTLRSKCQKTLPSSTVPDLIIPMTYIPLALTSGKADNKLLVKIFSEVPINHLMPRDGSSNNAAINRPMNDAEKQVWQIVSSVLKEQPQNVTAGSTVFELGIDSLSGISVFSKLRNAGYNCSVAMVMKNPTIEQLAASAKSEQTDNSRSLVKVREELAETERQFLATVTNAADIQSVRPCLPLQEVLIAQSLHQSTDGEDGAYVNHIRFKLDADVDVDRLRAAWSKLVRDNDIFRTCFSTTDDKFLQVVMKADSFLLPWNTHVDIADVQALQRGVGKEIVSSLTEKPPMRLNLVSVDGGHILVLSVHHALYDGNSLEMMIKDVHTLYDEQPAEVRPSVESLVEYIAAQDQNSFEKHWTTLLDHWESALLLAESSTKNVVLGNAERHLSAKLSVLEAQAASMNTTMATLLQLAFAIAMSQSLQTNDFIFGNVLSGRTIPVENADKIMGPCITTIPQRLRIENSDASIATLLTGLQSSNSSSLEYQHVSPRDIQKWTKADRPLYDTLFSFIRSQLEDNMASTVLKQDGSDIGVDYPLAVEFEADANADQLIVRAGFTETFGSQADAELLLEKIEMLIDTVINHSKTAASSFGIPINGDNKKTVGQQEKYDETNWSALEQQVRSIISKHTEIPEKDVDKDSAFIHLGIDSISAIWFAKKLRDSGIKVSSADIIRHNRIGSLCKHLSSSSPASSEETKIQETAVDTQKGFSDALSSHGVTGLGQDVELYECTPLQSGMLAQSLATEGALYMHHHATRCTADIDIARLKSAWESLVEELDVLRTTFHWLPKAKTPWIAAVRKDKKPSWCEVEVEDARQYWVQLTETSDFIDRLQQSFPLAGVHIVKDQEGTVLILTLHHAIYDGISLGMLYRSLAQRYFSEQCPPTTPFYEAARAITQNPKPAVKFWADQVSGYEGAPPMPTSSESTYTLAERRIVGDISSLDAKLRQADVDIKDVCVAAFGKALACIYGRRDVVFGHVMAARHSQIGDGNDVIGPMFNTVPFRVAMKDQLMTNRNLVQRVHEVNTGSIEYQHASLAEVQKHWRTSTSDPGAQLIDSIFVYSKIEKPDSRGAQVYGAPLESDKSPVPSEYRLNFEVEHTEDGLVARALSSAAPDQIEVLLDHFKQSIHDLLDQPGRFTTALPDQLRNLPVETAKQTSTEEVFDDQAVERYGDVIRKAMADVAQIPADKIALNTSIYSFGIDSIAAIQIVSRCKKAGVRLSVADILKGAMLGRICEIVSTKNNQQTKAKQNVEQSAELVNFKDQTTALATLRPDKDAVEDILPCLAGQEYHLLSWLQSGRTLYEPGWCYRSTTRLDVEKLRAAWIKLRERNSVLRTTFVAVSSHRAVQVVMRASAINQDGFAVINDERPVLDAVKDRAHDEARKPSDFFDIPVRLRLIKATDGDAVMVYVHHSLYDAWSMPRLVTELAAIYRDEEIERGPAFAQLIRNTAETVNEDEEQKFWSESLAGCEKAVIPSSRQPENEVDRSQGFALTEGVKVSVAELESASSKHNISPHHVVLLAFTRALAHVTETSSPLFGFFQLGRSAAFDNIDKVTGPCVNTLPLGLASVLTRPVLEVLKELQRILGARVPFEQSSLRSAVEAFDPNATQVPFNAYINLLWHKTSLVGEVSDKDLFQPLALGVPTDYSSPRAMPGRTAVDALDFSFLQPHQLFVDVGPGEKGIVFGARADAALMGADGIREFVGRIEEEVVECMKALV